jgi:hypothetical protein
MRICTGADGLGCKACDRDHRRRVQADTVRRPTERNAAGKAISADAVDGR